MALLTDSVGIIPGQFLSASSAGPNGKFLFLQKLDNFGGQNALHGQNLLSLFLGTESFAAVINEVQNPVSLLHLFQIVTGTQIKEIGTFQKIVRGLI